MRHRIYIAGPISKGDLLQNVKQADEAMRALMLAGFAPFNPMLSVYAGGATRPEQWVTRGERPVWAIADRKSSLPDVAHADWLGMDLEWVAVSHAVLRLPGESTGADLETAHAERHGIPVFHDLAALVGYFAAARAAA